MRSIVLLALFAATQVMAFGIDPEPREGGGFMLDQGTATDALPLVASRTTVEVAGVIARVEIAQEWKNAGRVPLEATYAFPVSTQTAVHDLRIRVGASRELRAVLRKKEEAQKIFDDARDEGKTAAMLQQQRPNVLTMHVTNIMPGDTVTVVVEATELIRPHNAIYELVLPQTIGARYHGNVGSEAFVENGHISGSASRTKTTIDATITSPIGVKNVGSPSHSISPRFSRSTQANVSIASSDADVVADRDVVLRWRLAGEEIETGVLLFRDKERDEHFFALLGEAPPKIEATEAPAREVVFVVDVSGSMWGFPIDTAKSLMHALLKELRPQDSFNVVLFSGGSAIMSPGKSSQATANNVAAAHAFVDNMRAGGGTELLQALRTAFSLEKTADVARTVVVVTDGYISAERAAYSLIRDNLGDATLFAFGIGSSTNRYLIEEMARAGRTEPFVVADQSKAEAAAEHFRTIAARPALTNVKVRFEDFAAIDTEPSQAVDLYPGRPLVMLGRFKGPASGNVIVTGTTAKGPYRRVIAIEDNLEKASHAPLRQLWARERIARLVERAVPTEAELSEAETLSLRYRVLTERTAFVVVDPNKRNTTGELAAVTQPSVETNEESRKLVGASMSGLGFRGTGPGGGGNGFGIGGLGSGTGRGSGGSGDLGGRSKGTTTIQEGSVTAQGSLSKEVVQRVVRRVMSQLKYCYEKRVAVVPTLAGKITVSINIAADGTVTGVTVVGDTVQDADVASCIARVLHRMQFPAGAAPSTVVYPFVFKS